MHSLGLVVLLAAAVAAAVVPATTPQDSLWRGTPMDGVVQDLEAACTDKNDGISCIKYKVLNLIDQALMKDSLQVSEGVSLVKNTDKPEQEPTVEEGESPKGLESRGLLDTLESYVQSHDMLVRLPRALGGQTLAVSARNIDDNEIALALRDNPESEAQVEERSRKRRKNKLKKILVPILVFVLLKAMTLIPLAIGVLGLKAWNALQLSFFSFLISISLAMFQLFKKIASDAPPPAAALHAAPWQDYSQYAAARTLLVNSQEKDVDGQQLAYNAYTSQ
ncbi:uncharacterized protein LOC128982815 [Macrosteles quadrilineatus]|uniref:uncharacterized protein LOC128982815 n=1 Tax=Macrosteles quadrilineatus TaxID=74068 RepID=UPI0023E140EE|nr:uncharacterized protein LOC128982815 [Macrosteles quadrilineatus]